MFGAGGKPKSNPRSAIAGYLQAVQRGTVHRSHARERVVGLPPHCGGYDEDSHPHVLL
jgi:hypothetical protein